ncbi:MAG TPA: NlpC/P60 family protein [Terriglobales bacterium]|nr:NlpC/P60 family protein [Terriglobales bacterium]
MRTLSARIVIFVVAFIFGNAVTAPAQTRALETFRMHASDPADEVWSFPESTVTAREVLLQLALQVHSTELDCSHFVHRLFERSGLPYAYAPSISLYKGEVTQFRRVYRAQPGDLIVWLGHVGVVVDPAAQTFLSALRSGVKVAAYDSHYWKRKGHARFFRYTSKISRPDRTLAMR